MSPSKAWDKDVQETSCTETTMRVVQTPEASSSNTNPLELELNNSLFPPEEIHDLVEQPQLLSPALIWSYRRVISRCLIISCAAFPFGYDTGCIGGLLELNSVKRVLGTYDPHTGMYEIAAMRHGLLLAMYHIGCIVGGFTIARLADYLGRKKPIQIAMCCYVLGITLQVTTVYTHKWWQFMIGRIVSGLCIGSAGVLGPMFISETAPAVLRGSLTSLYGLFITIGILIGSIVIFTTKSVANGNAEWTGTLLVGLVAAVLIAISIQFAPESSRYLISIGKDDEARKSLLKIGEPDVEGAVQLIKSKLDLESNARQVGFIEMLRNKHNMKRLTIGMLLMLFQQMSGVDYFLYFGTKLFDSVGIQDSYVTLIILTLVNHVTSYGGVYTVEKFGRKPIMLTGAFIEFICLIIYSTVGSTIIKLDGTASENRIPGMVMIIFTCIFIMAFSTTWAPSVAVVCSEVFPLHIKSKAFGLSIAFNWGANFFIAFCTPVITDHIHYLYGYVFAGFVFASFWFVMLVVPETRGISLEQMDTLFSEKESLELEL